jgi:hypothetical protein
MHESKELSAHTEKAMTAEMIIRNTMAYLSRLVISSRMVLRLRG